MDRLWQKVPEASPGAGPCQAQEPAVAGEELPLRLPVAALGGGSRVGWWPESEAQLVFPGQGSLGEADSGSSGAYGSQRHQKLNG